MATPQLDVYLPHGTVQAVPLSEERAVVGTGSTSRGRRRSTTPR